MLNTFPRPAWIKRRRVIEANSALIIDEVLKPGLNALRYKVVLVGQTSGEKFTFDLAVLNSSLQPLEVVANIISEGLDVDFSVTEDASSVYLNASNQESEDIEIEFARLTLKD